MHDGAAQNGAAIEVAGLGYTFPGRDRPTIENISLTLPRGSWTVVAGPTGSGKSTLLRAIVGLVPHLSRGTMTGTVRLFGRSTRTMSPRDLAVTVGFVLQSPDDQICSTIVETELAFGLENIELPVDEIRRRIADVAARFGLADQLRRPTPFLSGGMKQRLTLAAISAMRPPVLVCDEPLSQLDGAAGRAFLEELKTLHAAGLTIVMAEHRLDEVRPFADQIVEMNEGRLLKELSTQYSVLSAKAPISAIGDQGLEAVAMIENLSLQFAPDAPTVWSDVSFTLHRGERIALVGPNGAGKSTLLGALAGTLKPTSGTITWSGESPRFPATLVPQRVDLTLFNRSVFDELAYGPRQCGLDDVATDARVRSIARRLLLEPLLDEHPQALSQGQRVRTAIAAGLTTAPRLLLLDEPTTGQDAAAVTTVMEALAASVGTADGPETLVFSTHDLRTAARFADRMLVLSEGTLIADVTPAEVLANESLLHRAGLRGSR